MFSVYHYSLCDEDPCCNPSFDDGLYESFKQALNHVEANASTYEYRVSITNTDTNHRRFYRFDKDSYGNAEAIEVNNF